MSRGNLVFRIVVGGYLAYIGLARLLVEAVTKKPEHYMWFGLSGIVFGVIGLLWAGRSLIMLFKMKEEPDVEEESGKENELIKADESEHTIIDETKDLGENRKEDQKEKED